MVLKAWAFLLFMQSVSVGRTQDATGVCSKELGISSRSIDDTSITSPLGADTNPAAGRLGNSDGAWCFNNDSISSQNAALVVDLGRKRFVSGFASEGPPEKVQPKGYEHFIAFAAAHSLDKNTWEEFNGGTLFFDTDKNDTSDVVKYHVSSTAAFTQFVKFNVTMHIYGATTICLRFELYGCDTDIQPSTNVQAITTPKGKVDVRWQQPTVEIRLGSEASGTGTMSPGGYVVLYRPIQSDSFANAATGEKMISLEDVRLGATYVIELQCIYRDVKVSCGSTQVEAYPPCPEGWTGGNEYHCFLYSSPVSSFSEAKTLCLDSKFDQQLGTLGYLVDEDEKKFLVSRILPKDTSTVWFVGNMCQEKDDCCAVLQIKGGDTVEQSACAGKDVKGVLCLRDHKGEGAPLRLSSVEASDDGKSASFMWRYEGTGWKTDELQVKMWIEGAAPSTLTFSTLSQKFEINANAGTMYSLLLKPAPNIRTDEMEYKFIIIDFQDGSSRYGAVLTPVPMFVYIIWSGSLRVTWDEAKAVSKSGIARPATKYAITHQMAAPVSEPTQVTLESEREFQLTPIEMRRKYVFKMSCYFVSAFQPCGEISITTDPPNLVLQKPPKSHIVYETILDKIKTWKEAEEDCKQRSGHLTSLLDDAEANALLKMLPNKDAKMWTGAKIGRKGTGYWTDGQKITDLPIAKNSGVTSSSESCCRAIDEMGRLRLTGGSCDDRLPYICKYTVEEMMSQPASLMTTSLSWKSFELSWSKPSQRWLPTSYTVKACLAEAKTSCIVKNELKNLWSMKMETLKEFQRYEVEVEAVLDPVKVKTKNQISVMTYPRSPVRVEITPNGKGSVHSPMLVSKGFPEARVTVILLQLDVTVATVKGGVTDVAITNLVPEEIYKLTVNQDGGQWTHNVQFTAVPTCSGRDVLIDSSCFNLVYETKSFEDAKQHCLGFLPTADKNPMSLWLPLSADQLKSVINTIEPYPKIWLDKPKDSGFSKVDSNCATARDTKCCFYDATTSSLICSACCDQQLPFLCSYTVKKAYLGKVSKLNPTLVGNKTIGVGWEPPSDVSWSIRRFDVEWKDIEDGGKSVGKDVLVGALERKIEDLEFGTEYEVSVTPLGAETLRGETAKILITTNDPRTPIAVNVDQDGNGIVSSPLLMEKGRGTERVEVKLFKFETNLQNKQLLSTVKGQAQKVDISSLEVGRMYWVEMTPEVKDKIFNYSTKFSAYPSCEANQIQEKFVCVWAPPDTKTWREAAEICRGDSGELLDYKTQEELTQPVKALLTSYIQQKFWLDVSTGSDDLKSTSCSTDVESDVVCCTYETSEAGEFVGPECSCCTDPRPFACKKFAKINLGDIGDIRVDDLTATSLTMSWTLKSSAKWVDPLYIITWKEASTRQKREDRVEREVANQLVTSKSPASVNDLKPSTQYDVAVAPYVEATRSSGTPKEIQVTTKDGASFAGYTGGKGCTIIILKISCCITVILGSAITVFVMIATRMFYLDCLAQIFAELGTLGAYVCILVSSAQSYSYGNQCLSAHPTLCVAVSVLIQFFFQVVYLFIFLESLLICSNLKDFLPSFCNFTSPLGMAFTGFGIPAFMMILLAAIASDEFSDGDDNCWLDLEGKAMLPSVIPVIVFCAASCILLLSVFDADHPKDNLGNHQKLRARIFLKTRWACFILMIFTSISYGTGMFGVNDRNEILNLVFVGFSTSLGILMPIIRIRCDEEIRGQLKRGLFTSLRDDMGTIRVSPAPDTNTRLKMIDLDTQKYKQLNEMRMKEAAHMGSVFHQ